MGLMRFYDWRPRLLAYLRGLQGQRYDAKSFHCLHFACGAVSAMTGTDLMEPYRASSQAASRRLLKAAGHKDWPDALAHLRIEASAMNEGDLAILRDHNRRFAAGLCLGARLHVLGPNGLSVLDRDRALWGAKV